jgi:ribosome-associated heat shock protein Hsp15
VQVNGVRVKLAMEVRPGDTLEVTVRELRWTIVVRGLAERRPPASVAANALRGDTESLAEREQRRLERRVARPLGAALGARPTKQDRRRLEALRRAERRAQRDR